MKNRSALLLLITANLAFSGQVMAADHAGPAGSCTAAITSQTIDASNQLQLALPGHSTTSATAPEAGPLNVFEASHSRSQKLRDNAEDYWNYVRTMGARYFPVSIFTFEGWVIGDLHPGQFLYAPLNGEMSMFIGDIKDGGRAPLFADFQRFVTSTYAVNKGKVSLKKTSELLFDAYVNGLAGKARAKTAIDELLSKELGEYAQDQRDYVKKQTKKNRFKYKPGQVEPVPFATTEPTRYNALLLDMNEVIQARLPNARLLDVAFRPRERGGSKRMVRYWALIENKDEQEIIEFKQAGTPATEMYQPQADIETRYGEIRKAYWPREDDSYRAIPLDGKTFWMRPKKTDTFRVPYKQADETEVKFLLDLAAKEAYVYGQWVAHQDLGGYYRLAVEKNRKDLLEGLRQFSKDYMKHLKNRISDQEVEP
jgi:hypothetical protein